MATKRTSKTSTDKKNHNRTKTKPEIAAVVQPMSIAPESGVPGEKLFHDLAQMIEKARSRVVAKVNSEMVLLYWQIGKRVQQDLRREKRADYGKLVVEKVAERLQDNYGRGFSRRNLFHMVHFYEVLPDSEIVQTLSAQLSWSHLVEIIYIPDELKRNFYLEICQHEGWSVRVLKDRMRSMLYERTAISRKPEKLIKQELTELRDKQTIKPDLVFRDPYLLDFLGLEDTYSEKDLEGAILHKLGHFLVEFGSDFAFLSRQKRITIDNKDYYMDLLFYHRGLRSLVVIELKLGEFQAEYKGQLELYLRYLEKYEMREGENLPVGLILCAEKSREIIELLKLDKDRINVAEYWTKLPSRQLLEEHLHRAITEAQAEAVSVTKRKTPAQKKSASRNTTKGKTPKRKSK